MFRIEDLGDKGRGLVASAPIDEDDVILSEPPLVSSQFLWNAKCKYKACQFCMSSMEPAIEMARSAIVARGLCNADGALV